MILGLFKKIKESTKYNAMKKSIFVTWMLSYLMITLLSMICNGIIYNYAKNTIRKELIRNSAQAIDKFKMSVDSVLVDTTNIAKTLQNDGKYLSLTDDDANDPKLVIYNTEKRILVIDANFQGFDGYDFRIGTNGGAYINKVRVLGY